MTEIYLFRLEDTPLPESAAALLPGWRRRRYDAIKNESARQQCLAAGLLYAHAIRARGLPAEEPVAVLAAGKPVFRDRPAVFFSLTHTAGYALCAVADCPVGVDAQPIRPVRQTLFRRFHPEERAWLMAQPEEERQAAFFRLWTRKEAWVKAVSDGRMLSLSETDVIHGPAGLYFRDFTLPGGCAAAVCAAEPDIPDVIPVTCAELTSR